MRRPRVRFTVRRMMVAVAVVAVGIAGYIETIRCLRLRAEYQRKATYHARKAALYWRHVALAEEGRAIANGGAADQEREIAKATDDARKAAETGRRDYYVKIAAYDKEWRDYWVKVAEDWERKRTGYQRLADYHAGLAREYGRAAGRPWWSVPPDPPEPEDPLLDGDGFELPRMPRMRFDF